MAIQTTSKGALLAVGAAALILTGCAGSGTSTAALEAQVHCAGLNACKGTSDCKTAENACKGQNVCKGHGFLAMTAKACSDKGGSVI